ncbi:hypothetical protein [Larkinella humicola]|uniref:Uncharacterized protein n=1 Tax=Larkinella humicola TaxID=2607654 RepID=A0A5N1JUB3_9BACT|nr:hypothetical protein [Larkinella humicola]KAA9357363.1 hypothetical protein F0P93_06400 [Larkinella humicola]
MVLIIHGIRAEIEWRNLICFPNDYETAFDLLSNFVASGLTLLEASVSDGATLLKLPVDGFDGQLFSPHLQNLQMEWEEILANRGNYSKKPVITPLQEWDRQLIQYYEKQIERVCRNLIGNQKALIKAAQRKGAGAGLRHYELMQEKYLLLLTGFEASHQRAVSHLAAF